INVRENRVHVSLRWGFSTEDLNDRGFLVDALAISGVGQEAFVDGLASKGGTGDDGGAVVDDEKSLRPISSHNLCTVQSFARAWIDFSVGFPDYLRLSLLNPSPTLGICSIIDVPGYFLPLLPPSSAVCPLGAKDLGDLPSEALGGSLSILSTSPV
ncbi:hypothetical protein U1Q18_048815, partial [Sarracenia purpurea var. burkii]